MLLEWDQVSLPEPWTMQAYNLQVVYEYGLLLSLFVMLVVTWFLRMAVFNRITCSTYLECPLLELFWGSFPIVLLVVMCGISTYALYVNDETYKSPYMDVTVTGHQWYWSYKILVGEDCNYKEWDSRMIPRAEDSEVGFLDLLTVDRPLMVPVNQLIRVFVTSEDVIHSWGAPGLGIKVDAIPGRLTRGLFELKLPGIICGMCAELCGAMHAMMPTIIEGVPLSIFESWKGMVAGSQDGYYWGQTSNRLVSATETLKTSLGSLVINDLVGGGSNFKKLGLLEEVKNLQVALEQCQDALSYLTPEMQKKVVCNVATSLEGESKQARDLLNSADILIRETDKSVFSEPSDSKYDVMVHTKGVGATGVTVYSDEQLNVVYHSGSHVSSVISKGEVVPYMESKYEGNVVQILERLYGKGEETVDMGGEKGEKKVVTDEEAFIEFMKCSL